MITTLEINNDTVPLQGKIKLDNLPSPLARLFQAESIPVGNSAVINFKDGLISDQGTILITEGGNFIERTYYAEERPKFDG
jgi:hypothetical protein